MVRQALLAHPQAKWQVALAGQGSEWAASQLPASFSPVAMGYVRSREQLALCYEVADIFLFASEAENFPCVILEAMAAQCAVVATPTGGVREQIQSGCDGLLAETISGEALARALAPVAANPNYGRALGMEARRRVEKDFREEQMVARHLELYEALHLKSATGVGAGVC